MFIGEKVHLWMLYLTLMRFFDQWDPSTTTTTEKGCEIILVTL